MLMRSMKSIQLIQYTCTCRGWWGLEVSITAVGHITLKCQFFILYHLGCSIYMIIDSVKPTYLSRNFYNFTLEKTKCNAAICGVLHSIRFDCKSEDFHTGTVAIWTTMLLTSAGHMQFKNRCTPDAIIAHKKTAAFSTLRATLLITYEHIGLLFDGQ
jgi:hypothetical protein